MQRSRKLMLVMVGLPARGKSYIAHKLVSYYHWLGLSAQIFNVGKHRRQSKKSDVEEVHDQNFFDAKNTKAKAIRDKLAFEVLATAITWLVEGGDLAVFDATNTTDERRRAVLQQCQHRDSEINVIFVESVCDDPAVIRSNLLVKAKNSPDYRHLPVEDALADLEQRVRNYEKIYEPLSDLTLSFIKLINLQSQVVCNRIHGNAASRAINVLMATHLSHRYVYLVRAGSSEQSPADKAREQAFHKILRERGSKVQVPALVTKDSPLTQEGLRFAQQLGGFVAKEVAEGSSAQLPTLYVSTHTRTLETAQHIPRKAVYFEPSLNQLDTGSLAGKSATDFDVSAELARYEYNPFEYRFPGGMSRRDAVRQLEGLMLEIERVRGPVVVVAHSATLALIYGYFTAQPRRSLAEIEMPFHTVIRLHPSQFGWKETRFVMGVGEDGLAGLVQQEGTPHSHSAEIPHYKAKL